MSGPGFGGDFAFCPRCGTALEPPRGDERPRCPACGFVHWLDPKLATGVLAARDGRVLLVRRNHEPGMGLWSFPSGFVDRGEVVEAAAVREAFEEAGVRVEIERLLGVISEDGNPVVLVMFVASFGEQEPVAGDEALDVGLFAPDALPELAFEHDRAVIETWRTSLEAR